MALKFAEQRREKTSNKPADASTDFELDGPRTGFAKIIGAPIASTERVVICAQKVDANGNPNGAAENFVGTVTAGSPATLSREYFISGHDGAGAQLSDFIDWSATGEDSSPDVMVIAPADLVPSYSSAAPSGIDGSRWFNPFMAANGAGQFTNTGQTSFLIMDIPHPVLIKGARVNNGTFAAGASGRILIYSDRGGLPDKLLFQDTVSLDTPTGLKSVAPNIAFMGGRLWLGFQSSSSSAQCTGVSGSPGAGNGASTVYGPSDGASMATSSNGWVCTTQGYSDGALDPWNEALSPVANNKSVTIIQLQLEAL